MNHDTSQLVKNDMEQLEGFLTERDKICRVCGVRILNGAVWRTCSKWDDSFTCKICYESGREDEEEGFPPRNRCAVCLRDAPEGKSLCNSCAAGKCPKWDHLIYTPFWRYDPGLGSQIARFTKAEKEMETCIDCLDYKRKNPFQWAWDMWLDPMRTTHFIVTNKLRLQRQKQSPYYLGDNWTTCSYCHKGATRPHDTRFYGTGNCVHGDGKRLYFCNHLYDDNQDCYLLWAKENDELCPVEKMGQPCRTPVSSYFAKEIPHGKDPNALHSFWVNKRHYYAKADEEINLDRPF